MSRGVARAVAIVIVIALLAGAGVALGAYHPPSDPPTTQQGTQTVVAGPEPITYQNPRVAVNRGEGLLFRNSDVSGAPHDVTSVAAGPVGGRLFRSATIAPRPQPVPVRGVEALDPGSYPYFCSVHPAQMRGAVRVRGAVLGLGVRPRRARTRPGRTVRFAAIVRNRGDATTPSRIRVCARPPRGVRVRGRSCRVVPVLAAGETARRAFRVRATRRASGRRLRIPFTARSPGSRNARAQAVLRVP